MTTTNRADVIVDDLLRQGYSRIPLTTDEAPLLAGAFQAGAEFFAQDAYELKRFSGSSTNHGYRAFGDEYSISPDRPDQNDSFSLWADDTSTIPSADEIAPFLGALSDWRAVLLPMADVDLRRAGRTLRRERVDHVRARGLPAAQQLQAGLARHRLPAGRARGRAPASPSSTRPRPVSRSATTRPTSRR